MQISALNQNSLTKKVFSHSFFNVIASLISSFSRLVLIVFLTRFYTTEEFGLWASITSFSAILIVSDFGISNILRNKLSAYIAEGADRDKDANYLFSNVFFFFFVLTAILLLILFLWNYFFPLESLFNTTDIHLKEMGVYTLLIIQVISFISIPFGFAGVSMFSYHETKWFSILNSTVILLSVIIVCICAYYSLSILYIGIIYFSFPTLINIYSTIYFLKKRSWKLTPDFNNIIPFNLKIIYQGSLFFIVQLLSAFVLNATTLVISSNIGLIKASEYNLVQKLFIFAISIYQSAFNPLWAGYAQAIHTNDWHWCFRTFKKTAIITAIIFATFAALMCIFGNKLLYIFAGSKYVSEPLLFLILGVGFLFYILWTCILSLQNASNRMRNIAILLVIISLIFSKMDVIFIFFPMSIISISIVVASLYCILAVFTFFDGYIWIKQKISINK